MDCPGIEKGAFTVKRQQVIARG